MSSIARRQSIVSESESYYDDQSIYIEIKKEESKGIYLESKYYQKLIAYLTNTNETIKKLKSEYYKPNLTEKNIEINSEINKELSECKNILKIKENEIALLRTENSNLKEEISKIKNEKQETELKYQNLKNSFAEDRENNKTNFENLEKKITEYQGIILELENKIKKSIIQNLGNEIFENEKTLEKIISYLPTENKINILLLNKKIHFHYYYKNKCNELQKKLDQARNLIAEMMSKNIASKYGIDEEELIKIVDKFTQPHIITGNPMRYSIIHSNQFLENIVRKPLLEQHNPIEKNSNKKGIFDEFMSVMKNDENEITKILKKNKTKENLDKKIVPNFDENVENINKNIENLRKHFNEDEFINVKFEFKSPDEIKNLITFFLKVGLDKSYYIKFNQYLINEYCELLFNCNSCLNDIKQLEICVKILDIRCKSNNYLIKTLSYDLDNLKLSITSDKQIKEILIKQKRELEVKYNDSLMINNSLNQKIIEKAETIEKLKNEKKSLTTEVENLKNKIISEYKTIENKFNQVSNERNSLIKIFIEFKNYFVTKITSLQEI